MTCLCRICRDVEGGCALMCGVEKRKESIHDVE